ncbi:hypothetical protein XELAEV_18003006mg [Xenopus laevis]|nr:hypothetical protein XELAEV_18003006mg [Xenopus laevis]
MYSVSFGSLIYYYLVYYLSLQTQLSSDSLHSIPGLTPPDCHCPCAPRVIFSGGNNSLCRALIYRPIVGHGSCTSIINEVQQVVHN